MKPRLMTLMRPRDQKFDKAADSMRPIMQRPTRLKWSISPPRLTRLRKLTRPKKPITH